MEQTITCPNCRYTFRIAKEIFDKYREGISLKKHQMTDGDAILLDCVGCGRTLKISITTWNVIGDGPAEHTRGYEWVGGNQRPRMTGAEYAVAATSDAPPTETVPERLDPSSTLIRLTEYGRVEKPLPEAGLGVMLGIVLLCALPIAMTFGESIVVTLASTPGYVLPVASEKKVPELPTIPGPVAEPDKEQAPPSVGSPTETSPAKKAEEEPRLLTPVREPTFRVSGRFEKILRNYNKQFENVEKEGQSAK